MSDDSPLVLVVEDERDLSELYRMWLADSYRVWTAEDGRAALAKLDEDVDIVLLDRRMPDLSGDEVLDRIRNQGFDCRVAMVTAVEPDTDIVDMEFDDYLVKPVSEADLVRMVESLRVRDEYDDGVKQLFSLASKKALLESEKDRTELETSEEYHQLVDELTALRTDLDDKLARLSDSDDLTLIYQDLAKDDDRNE
ncbi:HalX domain-containing protein [Haloplanus aerogenes]|uniref:Response regulator n=1 Tax=Haloplanus aerogenes TaxID=660522 RepID=A0A3M0DAN3_9EURY|nr:HalX domain-containing protein [Haloplanus aerogenes]AZH26133.1 response regulator [Haloplanus aerogenes]RMB18414.1 response regulator receiver domain-containing protein [Haloplanus aerogenes]